MCILTCAIIYIPSLVCVRLFSSGSVYKSLHTSALKFWFYEILWGEKNNPDQNILDRTGCFCRTTTNKHANYRFHVNVNQTWWLTGWCDGWRRTSSLNSKVLWMSTTCETSPGKVRKSSHFAPPPPHIKKSELNCFELEILIDPAGPGEDASTSMSAAWKSCHSSVDLCCLKKKKLYKWMILQNLGPCTF